MKKIGTLVFRDLPTQVTITKKVRPIFYKEGDKIPKKYNNLYYGFAETAYGNVLCELQDETPVLKNEKVAGLPKVESIGGNLIQQVLYAPNKHTISKVIKIKKLLETYFLDNMKSIKINFYPVKLELKFFINEDCGLDHDNLEFFYKKSLLDNIQETKFEGHKRVVNPRGFIPNDSAEFIVGSGITIFETKQNPYLIVNFLNYDSYQEREADKANINLDRNLTQAIQDMAVKFANYSTKTVIPPVNLYDKQTGEYSDIAKKFNMDQYDYFFKQLTNTFL